MLKIVPYGKLKSEFPNGLKRGWELNTNYIPEAITALEQFVKLEGRRWEFRAAPLGKPFSKSVKLTENTIKLRRWATDQTIWIVPVVTGFDPATLTAMAISAAMSLAQMGLQALSQPKKSEGKTTTGVTYQGGLNTSTVGSSIAYLAGLRVFCGSQILEAATNSLRNAGGGSGYDGDVNGTLPGGGGDGTGSNPGADPSSDWIDTGTWRRNILNAAVGITGAAPGGGGGRQMATTGQTYAKLSALMSPGGGRTGGPAGDTIEDMETHIYLDKVALRDPGTREYNFQGVRWTYRPGELGQSHVGMLPGVPSAFDKSGGELIKANPPVVTTVNNAKADFVSIMVNCRLGWTSDKGNEKPDYMTLRFEVKRINSSTWISTGGEWNSGVLRNINGFDTDIEIAAPPMSSDPNEPWQFRIIRTRDDEPDESRNRDATLKAWTEYQMVDLTYDGAGGNYPAVSLFAITQQALDDGKGSFPEVALLWSGREVRVPSNYNPKTHTYSGLWNLQWDWKATENPVWIWLDMMTATDGMGLGVPLSRFNVAKLYEQAKYCDEMVNGKPRWTVNKQFSDEKPFWEHITEFCKSFRATPYYDGYEYYLAMDMPGMPIQHFINNDVVDGGLFDWGTTEAETRYNYIDMEFDDPNKWYEKSSTKWTDEADIAANKADGAIHNGIVEMTGYKQGCTSEQEAQRFANELGWCAINENETYSFKTFLNAADYRPGELVQIQDWMNSGHAPLGRVYSVIDKDTLVLPEPFTFEADVPYKLYGQVGRSYIKRDLVFAQDTTTDIVSLQDHGLVEDAPIGIIEANGVQLWTGIIRSIEEDEQGKYTVNCQQWIEEKFSIWAGFQVTPPKTIPGIERGVGNVRDLTGTKQAWMDDLRGAVRSVRLQWDVPATGTVSQYIIKHMAPSFNNYKLVDTTTYTWTDIEVLEDGTHHFTVEAVNMFGAKSPVPAHCYVTFDGEDSDEDEGFYAPVFIRSF